MPVVATYIQKEVTYFGEQRLMGNTYHHLVDNLSDFDDAFVANELKNAEKAVASADVKFVGWRTWGPTDGSEFANVMREDGIFNEVGALGAINIYREACLLIVWPLSRSAATNRKRWLRKFLRMSYSPALVPSADVLAGKAALSTQQQDAIKSAYANVVQDSGPTNAWDLCTEQGDVPTAAATVRPYYYTRQIGG